MQCRDEADEREAQREVQSREEHRESRAEAQRRSGAEAQRPKPSEFRAMNVELREQELAGEARSFIGRAH